MDGNVRLKIGNSSFFLPTDNFRFQPSLEPAAEIREKEEAPPIPPVRRKRQAKLAEIEREKEALEILQHIPAIQQFSKEDVSVSGGSGPEPEVKEDSDGSGHTLVESPKRGRREKQVGSRE